MRALISLVLLSITSCSQDITAHLAHTKILKPEIFLPGIVSSDNHNEFSIAISPIDAKTIFFCRRVGNGKQKIYVTKYDNGSWTTPIIASFSIDRDESPSFSKDGKTLYFGSQREIPNNPNKGNFDMNVWSTTLNNYGEWSDPKPLPAIINKVQIENEEWPSSNLSHFMTVDDQTFYSGTQVRGDKGLDIYSTTFENGQFSELKKLSENINKEDKWEYAPVISYDGQYLFFQVYKREDGFGGDDIFVSKKDKNGEWLPSKNIGQIINTKLNECPLAITADGKYFLFGRAVLQSPDDQDGKGTIYYIETNTLKLDSLFK